MQFISFVNSRIHNIFSVLAVSIKLIDATQQKTRRIVYFFFSFIFLVVQKIHINLSSKLDFSLFMKKRSELQRVA